MTYDIVSLLWLRGTSLNNMNTFLSYIFFFLISWIFLALEVRVYYWVAPRIIDDDDIVIIYTYTDNKLRRALIDQNRVTLSLSSNYDNSCHTFSFPCHIAKSDEFIEWYLYNWCWWNTTNFITWLCHDCRRYNGWNSPKLASSSFLHLNSLISHCFIHSMTQRFPEKEGAF